MTIRKTKSGKWTVDVSNGFHPGSHKKRIRIIRKGLKSKKEALELEQHIRVVEIKRKTIWLCSNNGYVIRLTWRRWFEKWQEK